MQNPVDFLIAFLQQYDEGKIFLPAGIHVHKIHTRGTPVNVWFGEVNSGDVPVCQGGINMYGLSLDSDGFILYAEVESDSVELDWQAELSVNA